MAAPVLQCVEFSVDIADQDRNFTPAKSLHLARSETLGIDLELFHR